MSSLNAMGQSQRFRFAVLALSALVLTLGAWTVANARSPVQFPIDLIPTFIAGKLWLAGHPEAVYHDGPWIALETAHPLWLQTVSEQQVQLSDTAFVYSPTYLAFLLPLIAVTSALQFYWFVAVANALCAFLLGWESARLAGIEEGLTRGGVAILVALSFPCAYAAMFGQNSIIAACCVLYAFRFFAVSRLGVGSVLLLIACACKPWCVLLLAGLLVQRLWKTFFVAATAYLTAYVAIPLLFFPPSLINGYHRVSTSLPKLSVLAYNNVSLRALITRLTMDDWAPHAWSWQEHGIVAWPVVVVELVILVPIGLWLGVRLLRHPVHFERFYPAAMTLVLLPLGVCWSHYLVFTLPLVVIYTLGTGIQRLPRVLACVCATWLMLLMTASAPTLAMIRPPALWALVYSAPLLLTALLAILTLIVRSRGGRPLTAHPGRASLALGIFALSSNTC